MGLKRKPTEERMREMIYNSNHPYELARKKGKEHLGHTYSNDIADLIVYIRELEAKLNIESVYINKK